MVFSNIYKEKKVLVTGHTGFKGTWLTAWLLNLGAQVIGISKDTVEKHDKFIIKHNLKVILGSDISGEICDNFGGLN